MQIGSATEVGLVRRRNEDALLVDGDRRVFAVADGLGGHPAGDVASQLAIEVLEKELQGLSDGHAPDEVLAEALRAAHEAVMADGWEEPSRRGMATTAVVAHLPQGDREAWVAHVGDSRAYLLHEGQLNQLTRDHTTGGPFLRG
ncbi:MAG: protein phosphatase 2C domain-containing protein, partial [Actinomycetota bacterium]|nr:protein phosphatase 2C domain-containing protein [Actinomycetota bacterium]